MKLHLHWGDSEPADMPVALPSRIEVLRLTGDFSQRILVPPRLRKLVIAGPFHYPLDDLPDSLTKLDLSDTQFNHNLHVPSLLGTLLLPPSYSAHASNKKRRLA